MNKRQIIWIIPIASVAAVVLLRGPAAQAAPKVRWAAYKSNALSLQVSVPADWTPAKIPNALAFRYNDLAGGTAGIGIMRSSQNRMSIEEAADKEFTQEGRPSDWVRTPARVSGMRAIKMVGTSHKNPDQK